jgi:nitrate/TMAO reductase-like tetraheme cytochrome c subunit
LNGVNPFDYLIALQKHAEELAKHPAAYADIFIFIILPAFSFCGLVLVIVGMVRERRRIKAGGPAERRFPVVDFNDPAFRSSVFLLGGGFVLLSLLYAFASYKAYEYTESDAFCINCHIERPEYNAHLFSPHARIGCSECHVGSGAKYYIRSKLNGTIELYKYVFNKYPRPTATPIENLRPSHDICETCHGPRYQLGEKLISKTHFLSDKQNTKWIIDLLLQMGTGRIETDKPQRIHWHYTVAKEIRYATTDPKRMVIPWIRVIRFDGSERVYRSSDSKMTDKDLDNTEKRVMDCIDCHNRDGHFFRPPALSVNAYLQVKLIDPSLPEIKSIAVKALENTYGTRQAGIDGIRQQVIDFYQKTYPDLASSKKAEIERAVTELQNIYGRNYDPSMKVSWKNFPDNASHMYTLGCFRCHDGKHVTYNGKVLSKDCALCHLLLTQKVEAEKRRGILTLATNPHPVDIGDAYKEQNCSECHGQ